MHYKDISYRNKLKTLLALPKIKYSSKLAEELAVSRASLVNWMDDDSRIKEKNKVAIDTAYCKKIILMDGGFTKKSNIPLCPLPEDFFKQPQLKERLINKMSFGSLEIETGTSERNYNKVIADNIIPNDIKKQEYLEINGIAATTNRIINEYSHAEHEYPLDSRRIRDWHGSVMQGIRTDAGQYAKSYRVLPNTEVQTTLPEDIEAEMEYWVPKYKNCKTMLDIAKAHAHFELIHPFGDGNGRVGRFIVMVHCLKASLMPPIISKYNKELYYVVLEYAQVKGIHEPLAIFLNDLSHYAFKTYWHK